MLYVCMYNGEKEERKKRSLDFWIENISMHKSWKEHRREFSKRYVDV